MSERRAPVSPALSEPAPAGEAEAPEPAPDPEAEAIAACDRPGLDGGVNFWDLWRQRGGPNLIDP